MDKHTIIKILSEAAEKAIGLTTYELLNESFGWDSPQTFYHIQGALLNEQTNNS